MLIAYRVKYSVSNLSISELVVVKQRDKLKTLREQLAGELDISAQQILSVMIEFGANSEIRSEDLSVVLISLYSATLSNISVIDTLIKTLDDIYHNKDLNQKLELFKTAGLTISDIFARLHVNTVLVALINSGEKADNLAQSFLDADYFLDLNEQTKKASQSKIGQSILYMVVGVFLTFVTPILLADFLNKILETGNKKAGNVVVYFNFMADNAALFSVIFIAIIATITASILNKQLYKYARKLSIFKLFDNLSALKKAIIFVPFYSVLNKAGMSDKQVAKLYQDIDSKIGTQLSNSINQGKSLAQSIAQSDMPSSLARNITTILNINNPEAKSKAFIGLITLLKSQILREGRKISLTFSLIGYGLIFTGLFTLVLAYQTMITSSI